MRSLRFTLVSEGSSDQALIPLIIWSIRQRTEIDIEPAWADLRQLRRPPRRLRDKIREALVLYPCDLLFVHRDADRRDRLERKQEIERALAETSPPPAVCVIPVRTLEAWFLFDEQAIRRASGNPNGKVFLDLPSWNVVERLSKPKARLEEVILVASGLQGRRRQQLELSGSVRRIAALVRDFAPLRQLPAFNAFEHDLSRCLDQLDTR